MYVNKEKIEIARSVNFVNFMLDEHEELNIESEYGEGTTVSIYIPLYKEENN